MSYGTFIMFASIKLVLELNDVSCSCDGDTVRSFPEMSCAEAALMVYASLNWLADAS